jgi:hypothetical protein
MPRMMRSSLTPSALTSRLSIVLPSRRIVLDLVQLVADHDRGDALGLEADDEVEEVLRLLLVERRSGLVEDEELHVFVECLGDLDELLLADAQRLDLLVGVFGQADPSEEVLRGALRFDPVDDAAPAGLVAEEDVLGDRELGDQRQLLVDDHDAGGLGLLDTGELGDLGLEDDLAGVRAVRVDTREDFHESRLARTVLAADRVDLAGLHGQGHVGEGLHTGEFLGDRAHLEDGWATSHCAPPFTKTSLSGWAVLPPRELIISPGSQ